MVMVVHHTETGAMPFILEQGGVNGISLLSLLYASIWDRKCPVVKLPKNPLDGPSITQMASYIQSSYNKFLLYTSGKLL